MKIEKAEPKQGLVRLSIWVTPETKPKLEVLKAATGKSLGRIVSELVEAAEAESQQ